MQLSRTQSDKPDRRQFLAACSALTLSATLSPATLLAGRARPSAIAPDRISFARFSAQVGTAFRVWANSEVAANLLLVEAKAKDDPSRLAPRGGDGLNERFSLMFLGTREEPLEQDTYLFEHSRIGAFPMFIVPLHSHSRECSYYEAIFNRRLASRSRHEF